MRKFFERWFSRKRGTSDKELDARLSRLRSEFMQARAVADVDSTGLDDVGRWLESAEALARGTDDSDESLDPKEECIRLAHEVEAELCLFKPFELLYPTWTRLRPNLYRLDDDLRRKAWEKDVRARISADVGELDPTEQRHLRQRLRQLTLELRESALRFNRLNDERAEVTKALAKFGVCLAGVLGVGVAACLTLSGCGDACEAKTLVLLLAAASAGGLGALFSRTAAPRDERLRLEYKALLKWDLAMRVCFGAAAALLVAAILLSGRPFELPDGGMTRAAYLVVFGFGAGFSDRFFKSMLAQSVGARRSRSSDDRK